jgi:hypothetical protein
MLDKDKFYKAIDFGDHLNTKTKEAYWTHFTERCDKDLKTLYMAENVPFPTDTGIHQYVRLSIDKFSYEDSAHKRARIKESQKPGAAGDPKISPIDKDWKKESATTWGTNDDVRYK